MAHDSSFLALTIFIIIIIIIILLIIIKNVCVSVLT